MIAKEYGAWSMLLVAFVLGPGVGANLNVEVWLVLGLIAALFLARYPLVLWLKKSGGGAERGRLMRWTGIYSLAGLLLLLPLLLLYDLWGLLYLGVAYGVSLAAYVLLVSRRKDRTTWGELWAVAGASLAAPAAYYAATGRLGKTAFLLWLLSLLYSGASVFYVPMKFRHRSFTGMLPGKHRRSFAEGRSFTGILPVKEGRTLLYLGVMWLTLGLLALGGHIPWLALVAFLPLVVKTVHALVRVRPSSIRRIGFTEVAHVALFALLLIGAYRLPLE